MTRQEMELQKKQYQNQIEKNKMEINTLLEKEEEYGFILKKLKASQSKLEDYRKQERNKLSSIKSMFGHVTLMKALSDEMIGYLSGNKADSAHNRIEHSIELVRRKNNQVQSKITELQLYNNRSQVKVEELKENIKLEEANLLH